MSCFKALGIFVDCSYDFIKSFAEFFVVQINAITFFSCIGGLIIHFIRESHGFKTSEHFKNLIIRLFASANAPMIPALIACAAFNDLLAKLQGVTVNLLVAAFACAYVTVLAFLDD